MKPLGKRMQSLASYVRVLQGPAALWRYAGLRRALRGGHASADTARPLRVRALGGATLLCRPSQDVWTFKHTFLEGFHQPPVPLPADATIVDLGSNVGYTVADLAYRHPGARVIGVEMDAENAGLARRNTAWLGERVTIVHAAAWTSDGEIQYGGDADDAFAVDDGGGGRTAPAKAIATLFAEHGVKRADYVKMDIEGGEAALLAGPLDWLDRVQAIKIEIHPPATAAACRAVLESRGLRTWIDDRHWDCVVGVRDPVPAAAATG